MLFYCPEITSSNLNDATAIDGQESKKAKLSVLSWVGGMALSPVNQSDTSQSTL